MGVSLQNKYLLVWILRTVQIDQSVSIVIKGVFLNCLPKSRGGRVLPWLFARITWVRTTRLLFVVSFIIVFIRVYVFRVIVVVTAVTVFSVAGLFLHLEWLWLRLLAAWGVFWRESFRAEALLFAFEKQFELRIGWVLHLLIRESETELMFCTVFEAGVLKKWIEKLIAEVVTQFKLRNAGCWALDGLEY